MPVRSSGSVTISYRDKTRDEVVRQLQSRLRDLSGAVPGLRLVVLFGSTAQDRHTAGSDIELLVVHDDPHVDEAYQVVRRSLAMPGLEPHVYSQSEHHAASGVIMAMMANGIVVYDRDLVH